MSMPISTTTPFAAPPMAGDVAQAAPAMAATDAVAAFADWMGLGAEAVPADFAVDGDAPAAAHAEAATPEAPAAAEPLAAAEQRELGALQAMMMTMPVTLALPAQVPAQAAQAAADRDSAPADAPAVAPAAATLASAAAPAPAPAPAAAAAPAFMPVQQAAVQVQPQQAAQPAPAFAATLSQAAAAAPAPIAAADAQPAAAADAPVTATGAAAGAPAAATVAATELKLAAAKPADWQQPLREALGERLQLQLSKNIDQAVIRLDPPNLGRVEIAIRHMAGTLEVNISATHTEVVRQLHTISDTMRADLAQRHLAQFSQAAEVAVTISAAPRGAAGQQQAFDQQGRQRQQGQAAEDNGPGRGLAEAGNPSSTFSLNARESYA